MFIDTNLPKLKEAKKKWRRNGRSIFTKTAVVQLSTFFSGKFCLL